MNADEYQTLAQRTECDQTASLGRMVGLTCHPNDNTVAIRLNHAVIGAAGEVGELANMLERCIYYGKGLDREKFKDELGDVLWYLAEACNALSLSMGEVMQANIRKLRARYPNKFTEQLALERDYWSEQRAVQGTTVVGWPAHPTHVWGDGDLSDVCQLCGIIKPTPASAEPCPKLLSQNMAGG